MGIVPNQAFPLELWGLNQTKVQTILLLDDEGLTIHWPVKISNPGSKTNLSVSSTTELDTDDKQSYYLFLTVW